MNISVQRNLKKITDRIKERYYPEKIILFGSAASGRFKEGSDIDLFIVKNTRKPSHLRIVEIFRLLRKIPREYPLDFVVFTPAEMKKRLQLGDFFVKNILQEGKVLYGSK